LDIEEEDQFSHFKPVIGMRYSSSGSLPSRQVKMSEEWQCRTFEPA